MELESNREKLRAQGLGLAAISYDSVAVLKNFATRKNITFPMLSDQDSAIIRSFGILNEAAPKGLFFGIPHPGTFVVDPKGVVVSKYFEQDYTQRFTTSDILLKEFGVAPGQAPASVETRHLRLAFSPTATVVRSGQRIALMLDVELKKKMHVYAPGVEGYIAVDFSLDEAAGKAHPAVYPKSKKLRLKAIKETALVYDSGFRVVRDFTIAPDAKLKPLLSADGEFTIKGAFKYQACDDKICYIPQTIPLEWKLKLEGHDRERAPKDLQRKP